MIKSLILVASLLISGLAQADLAPMQSRDFEVHKADVGDILGGILVGAIIGKIIKDSKKDKHQPAPEIATQKVRIPMHGEFAAGDNTIYLRSELRDRGIDLTNRRVKKVTLVAKSLKGQAEAYLLLGDTEKALKPIRTSKAGYPFQSDEKASYHRISWQADRDSSVIWQIHMHGLIRVQAVVVELL